MSIMNFGMTIQWYRRVGLLAAGILLLAYADVIVYECIYKPLCHHYGVPASAFLVPGFKEHVFWWHVAFLPLGISLFVLLGIAGRDWRLAVSGIILFATGWEDVAYYAIQWKLPAAEMRWLDLQPFVAWTKMILGTPHVTQNGLWLATGVGGLVVLGVLLIPTKNKRPKQPGRTSGSDVAITNNR